MNANSIKGLLATVTMAGAYTISDMQLFDLRLRIALSICGLIVGIPATLATIWHGFNAVRQFFTKQ
jgi:hypothetical protein